MTEGADVIGTKELKANASLTSRGVMLFGDGFIVSPDEAKALGLGSISGLEKRICPYRNGRDLTDKPRGSLVIDFFGLSPQQIRDQYPAVYQHMLTHEA